MSDGSTKTISGVFENRELAERVVERLVQEYGVKRSDVHVVAAGTSNSYGETLSGGDAGREMPEFSPPLRGPVKVSADIAAAEVPAAENTFRQLGAHEFRLE